MRILIVAAHPDDECLGAGGSIVKFIQAKHSLKVVLLSSGANSRSNTKVEQTTFSRQTEAAMKAMGVSDYEVLDLPDQGFEQLRLLDINQKLEKCFDEFKPEVVYTHHPKDLNRDHQITAEAVLVAGRALPGKSLKEIYFWETRSSTEWAYKEPGFRAQMYEDISDVLDQKLAALSCYASELREFPHPRSIEGVRHLAALRGSEVGRKAAEAFEVFRILR